MNYPLPSQSEEDHWPMSLGLVEDVAEALSRHGYPPIGVDPAGARDYVRLRQHVWHFITDLECDVLDVPPAAEPGEGDRADDELCSCCNGDPNTVCNACGNHACWAGDVFCADFRTAGTRQQHPQDREVIEELRRALIEERGRHDQLRQQRNAAAPGVQLGRLSIALHQIQRVVDAYLDDSARAAQADVAEGWPELATALDEMSSWYETWAVEDDPELRADLEAAEGES